MRDPSADLRPARRPGRPAGTTMDALVAAALDLGLRRFTLRAVAARVGVSPSTAYTYVASREQLFAEAASTVFARLDTGGDFATWTAYVEAVADRTVELARAHPGVGEHVLYGPYPARTVATFEAVIERVSALCPGIPDHVAWVLASRPVVVGLGYLGDPVLEPMVPWIRTALIEGLDARIRAGDLPPAPPVEWRRKLVAG